MKRFFPLLALLCLCLAPAAIAAEALDAELFPPEFLIAQRDAIGLTDTQLQAMDATMQAARGDFEKLKAQLDERARALQEVLHQSQPDAKQAEEKLRALLAEENEVKLLHMLTMIKLRSQLTPEQLEKARSLHSQLVAGATAEAGQRDRIQHKLEQLRDATKARADSGDLPPETMERARQIQQMLMDNKGAEAEHEIDELLKKIGEKAKE